MMARVANVNIPDNKKVEISLTYIYGIGPNRAKQICAGTNISVDKRVKDLQESEIALLGDFIRKNYEVEEDLKRKVVAHIQHLKYIRCYRGIRHIRGLPTRGQNTHSNARTRKGKKGLSVPGKKTVKK